MTAKAQPRRSVGKRQNRSVQTLDALRRVLLARREERHPPTPWRVLALDYPDVPAGTLCAISKGRDPRKPAIRAALHLPAYQAAAVCPVHGVVHTGRCPRKSTDTYDAWKARNLPALLAIVAWAEGRRA